ncbi:hypothetical protein IEQ34_016724 [Dendrobium chrysotoxum]|uniref:Uncharacterized protein n=1 Tax=Dendrobium chrysotoxum TaxID=161865 RepID=A0AAV7FYG1_DENCH|nr:hypothetical protein IEQ34_016724 [Dendrobium chrysotoxum]
MRIILFYLEIQIWIILLPKAKRITSPLGEGFLLHPGYLAMTNLRSSKERRSRSPRKRRLRN